MACINPFDDSLEDEWEVVQLDGQLYFSADDGAHAEELSTYSKATGAMALGDIWPGVRGSDPAEITVLDGNLYFRAHDQIDNLGLIQGLWAFDPSVVVQWLSYIHKVQVGTKILNSMGWEVVFHQVYTRLRRRVVGI